MNVARDHLRSFVERLEHVQKEIDEFNACRSDIYAEAKAMGFDKKALKRIVYERGRDATQRADDDEFEAILDTYRAALGMLPDFETDEAPDDQAPDPSPEPPKAGDGDPMQHPERAGTGGAADEGAPSVAADLEDSPFGLSLAAE